MLNKILLLTLLCIFGTSMGADAQIYSWKGPDGILVLSSRPSGTGVVVTHGVAVTALVTPPMQMSVGSRFEPLIREHAGLHGIRTDLVRAIIQVESAFNPRALSPKGAMGLMQLMPATAAQLGVSDPFNPAENIRGGVSYFKQLLNRYHANEQLALAAYNAGPGAVDKYGSTVPPYKETQSYVRRIAGLNSAPVPPAVTHIYKILDVVGGQTLVRYTNARPSAGSYEEVRR